MRVGLSTLGVVREKGGREEKREKARVKVGRMRGKGRRGAGSTSFCILWVVLGVVWGCWRTCVAAHGDASASGDAAPLGSSDPEVANRCAGVSGRGYPEPLSAGYEDEMLWGSYDPSSYFALRTRSGPGEGGVKVGVAWSSSVGNAFGQGAEGVRQGCNEGQGLGSYGWTRHDGRRFGEHDARDDLLGVHIRQSFVKREGGLAGGEWTARVEGRKLDEDGPEVDVAVTFYVAVEADDGVASLESLEAEHNGEVKAREGAEEGAWGAAATVVGEGRKVGRFRVSLMEEPSAKLPAGARRPPLTPDPMNGVLPRLIGRVERMSGAYHWSYHSDERVTWKAGQEIARRLSEEQYKSATQYLTDYGFADLTPEERAGATMEERRRNLAKGYEGEHSYGVAALPNVAPEKGGNPANVVAVQRILRTPFEVDLVYQGILPDSDVGDAGIRGAAERVSGRAMTEELARSRDAFDSCFESTFGLEAKGFDAGHVGMARHAVSNLVGGIGYFVGDAWQETGGQQQVAGPFRLFTAVPARQTFPRGFLWDEGFHGLLLARFDRGIAMDVVRHWANLVNDDGWLPREQILGDEARSRVPHEFIMQRDTVANPPTLLLTVEVLLDAPPSYYGGHGVDLNVMHEFMSSIHPALERWHRWLARTQRSETPDGLRWQDSNALHTMSSGLDDYPRSAHPNPFDAHVDLAAWVAWGARVLARVAEIAGDFSSKQRHLDALVDRVHGLHALHWNADAGMYCDVRRSIEGLSDAPWLNHDVDDEMNDEDDSGERADGKSISAALQRREKAKERLAARQLSQAEAEFELHTGYVSLLPFVLGVTPGSALGEGDRVPELATIELIGREHNGLWSPYGLRSLASSDSHYELGDMYWTGPIWMNINYLAVRALWREGPAAEKAGEVTQSCAGPACGKSIARASELYGELRANLIQTVYSSYNATGYLWENYSDRTGEGQRAHPFTGWTSTVVLMMAEMY